MEKFNWKLQKKADRYGMDLCKHWEKEKSKVPEENRSTFFNIWNEYQKNCERVQNNIAKIIDLKREIVRLGDKMDEADLKLRKSIAR